MEKSFLLVSKRSAIGKFLGSLYEQNPIEASSEVINGMFGSQFAKKDVDSCIVGNVISAGMGQGLAREISIKAGIPETVPAYSINMVCGSGMKAIMNSMNEIKCGDSNLVLAGGVEFMSNIPFATDTYLRMGKKFGDFNMVDLMTKDGLTDSFSGKHMGITAENIARKYHISRREQDEFANLTQQRAIKAVDDGKFKNEIVPVTVHDYKGNASLFDTDEFPNRKSTLEKLASLSPSFLKDGTGTVTAGNTSGINDGIAFSLIASSRYVKEKSLEPEFEIVEAVSVGCDPGLMGLGPFYAIKKLLQRTGLTYQDVGCYEINEAFAAQVLGVYHLLAEEYNVSMDDITGRTNIWGSGIGLGHPLGATGARLVTTLSSVMHEKQSEYGIASLCIGGGMGNAVLLKKIR